MLNHKNSPLLIHKDETFVFFFVKLYQLYLFVTFVLFYVGRKQPET